MGRSRLSGPACISVAILVVILALSAVRHVEATVAQFIFGDSLVDQGNNNNLASIARANFPPNGIDLAMTNYQPTGRFSNGRIVSDFLSEYLGTPSVLAYNDPDAHGQNLLRGCNFGSAGTGLLDDTGAIFIQHITIPQQLDNFQKVKAELSSLLGPAGASQLVTEAIYSFTVGGNDYVNNYLLPGSQRARQFTRDQYTNLLIDTFKQFLIDIYNLGARKVSISNVGPIGCIPSQLSTMSNDGSCIDDLQQLAIGFNSLLKPMVLGLNQELSGATFVYTDGFSLILEFIKNPSQYGFVSANTACCGTGKFNGLLPCTPLGALCSNRDEYLFWDPFHPTDKANYLVSQRLLFGDLSVADPVNISQLIAL